MKYYLAIDIGASSGRHILAHREGDRLVTEEIYRFQNGPVSCPDEEGGMSLYWDTERLYAEILNGLRVAHDLGKEPETVGIDTWGVDYVLLDEDDRPVNQAYSYRDSRTVKSSELVHAIVPFSELYARTGIMFCQFNTVYQLYDDLQKRNLVKAASFLMLPDYFHFRLTGIKYQEYTNATTTGLVNATTHTWDRDLLGMLGFPQTLFGKLSAPGEMVGWFSEETVGYVGYRARVILPSTHDTASAVLAAPLSERAPNISSGTWSLLGVEQDEVHATPVAEASSYSNEGTYDFRFRLQKNIMGLWPIQQVRHERADAYDFATLAKMAEASPIPDVVNINDPRFFAPENMTIELCHAVGRELPLGEIAYCIYNSLAVSYRDSLADLEKLTGEHYPVLHIIGGGSKNDFLNRLTADYIGRPVITGPAEGTALGNLIMQMIGEGDLSSVAEGRAMVRRSFDIGTVLPGTQAKKN